MTNSPYKVLPETPLSAIVADYKTRQQSSEQLIDTNTHKHCVPSLVARTAGSKSFMGRTMGETSALLESAQVRASPCSCELLLLFLCCRTLADTLLCPRDQPSTNRCRYSLHT